jgi:predicted nucleic-acid-binding Zn-ribbon protein
MDTRIKKGVLHEMMKKADVKKNMVYTIDLTKIDGDGAFPCPKCGSLISPEDETDSTYEIVETRVKGDDLEELVLTCKKCGTTIKLVGFLSQPQA